MKLFLIGLLGSGKSVLGREISQAVSVPFIDLDEEIEKQEGLTIAQLFTTKGEDYFRNAEAAMLRKQCEATEFVMATGGGTPCFHDNMKFINQQGISVFLNTPMQEIARRLAGDPKKSRPLLEGVPDEALEQKLDWMLQKRLTFYKQAHFSVNGTSTTATEILQLISTKK